MPVATSPVRRGNERTRIKQEWGRRPPVHYCPPTSAHSHPHPHPHQNPHPPDSSSSSFCSIFICIATLRTAINPLILCTAAPHRTALQPKKVRTYASASRSTFRVAVNVSSTRKTDLLSLAQQLPSNRQPIFPSTHAPITMFRSTLLVAVTALAAVANAQNYSTSGNLSIDATQIQPALRQSWCRGQMIACPQICGGRASSNTCDSVSEKQKCASSPSNAGRLTRTRKT